MLQSLCGMVHSYFWQWQPILAAFSEIICEIISGGSVLMLSSSQIYICDVSTKENRTMRLGLLLAVKTLCDIFSNGTVGFLLRAVGFYYSYLLCWALSTISLVLALAFVRDVSEPVNKKRHRLQFFNPVRIVDSFRITFKNSLGKKRIIIGLLLLTSAMVFFTILGEKSLFYLFFRNSFHCDEKQYSVYVAYKTVLTVLGALFCSLVLSKHFKIHDGIIGMFAGFWDTIAVLCYLFAYQNWQLYAIRIFEMFHGTAFSLSQSFFSKYYDSSEFGRLNAVQNMASLVVPFCFPTYNIIFQKTIDFFPSAFFILSISLDVVIILSYALSYYLYRKYDREPAIILPSNVMKNVIN